MAEVDNDGEHETNDKDDLQVLKVCTSPKNNVGRFSSFRFKAKKSRLMLVKVVMQLVFRLISL